MMVLADARHIPLRDGCVQCVVTSPPYWGAQRDYGVPGQLGHERTPEAFVGIMADVFDDVARVLKSDGVLWLNIGDSYAASGKGGGGSMMAKRPDAWSHRAHLTGWRSAPAGYKSKDLVGVPWMLAFELRRRGWYLRRDVVWAKVSATEPTRADRPSTAHEFVFLMTRAEHYRYDGTAHPQGSVWRFSSDGASGAHFATMPEKLAERCILAGSRPGDLVLDPFGGSGTTVRVARRFNRRGVMLDLNPAYLELAKQRNAHLQPSVLDIADEDSA